MELDLVSGYPKYPKEALLKVSSRSNTGNLVKTTPIIIVNIFLESWRTGMFLIKLEMVSGYPKYPYFTESFMKIQHKEACQDYTYQQNLFLESWRTWRFLMKLELVSGYPKYPKEALLKVSSRSNIEKLFKTTPIIKVSSWSLGGHGGS